MRTRIHHWLAAAAALCAVFVARANDDPAPIPAAVVQKLTERAIGSSTTARIPPDARALEYALDNVAEALRTQARRADRGAAEATERMIANGASAELRALRERLGIAVGEQRPTRPTLGASRRASHGVLPARAALRHLDTVLDDLTLLGGESKSGRSEARKRLLSSLGSSGKSAPEAAIRPPQPNFVLETPRTPIELPAAEAVPAYLTAERMSRAMRMYAFAGDVLLVAAPSTPMEASSCDYVAADLAADGEDIVFTEAIEGKAEELGHSAVRIYEFVANEIAFEPYYGALKGADATLRTKAGSATDQASLLIALLRASNIPARYVRGTVRAADEAPLGADSRVNRWLQTKGYQGSAARLLIGGNPTVSTVSVSSQIVGIRWAHVWAEACVPYAHYRGARLDNAGHRWVPLDPSFEIRRYRAAAEVEDDFDLDDVLAQRTVALPHEMFETFAATELNAAGVAVNEAGYRSVKDHLAVDILPATLPYQVERFTAWADSSSAETAELPDAHRYQMELDVESSAGVDLLTPLTLKMNQTAMSRLTVGFDGVTTPDQTSLAAWRADDDPNAVLPCVNVRAVVRRGGNAVGTGASSSNVCTTNIQVKVRVRLPELSSAPVITGCGPTGNDPCVIDGAKASDLIAINVNAYQNTPAVLAEKVAGLAVTVNATPELTSALDATLGEYLDIVGRKYLHYVGEAARRVGQLGGETGDVGLSFGIVRTKSKVERVLDQPLGIVRDRLLVDFPGLRARSRPLLGGTSDFELFKLAGYASSAYESYVWQENARTDAVSTIRGLQFANESAATDVLTLTSATGTSALVCQTTNPACSTTDASFGYPAGEIAKIQALLADGKELKIPKRQIAYGDWTGIVYVHTESTMTANGPLHQAGFPIIRTNAASGGETLGSPIGYLYSPSTNFGYQQAGAGNTPISPGALASPPTFVSNGGVGNGASPYNSFGGDPVNLVTGNFHHTERDLVIPWRDLPLVFERTYNSLDIGATPGPLGYGWRHSFEHELRFLDEKTDDAVTTAQDSDNVPSTLEWIDGSGGRRRIAISGATTGGVPTSATFATPQGFVFTVTRTGSGYFIREKNGLTYTFENLAGTVNQTAKLTKITSANSNALTLVYSSGRLVSVTDDNSRQLLLTYTGNRLTRIEDHTGRRHEYVYSTDELRQYKNPLAVAGVQEPVEYEYFTTSDGPNFAHKMKRYALPKGNAMSLEYYVNGRVFRHTNTAGEQFTFRYNDFRRETVMTDARGFDVTYLFDAFGNPVELTAPDGARSIYAYDDPNDPHLRTSATNAYGHTTTYAYDGAGNLTQVTNPSGSTVVYSHYNGFGRPGKIKDARGNYRLLKYNGNGNLVAELVFKEGVGAAAADPATYTPAQADLLAYTSHTYIAGNRTSTKRIRDVANDRGLTLTWTYTGANLYPNQITRCGDKDGDGVVTDDPCDVAPLVYDAVGRLTSGVDARFEAVSYAYDAVDRITAGTDAVGQQRSYTFDSNGNPTGETLVMSGAGGVPALRDSTFHEYDDSDRRATTIDAGGGVTWFSYDAMGNLTNVLDPDAFTIGFRYDEAGRVIAAFDEEGRQAVRALDGLGREKSVIDPNGNRTTYAYYGAAQDGRLKEACDGEARCTSFEYDANGNVTRVLDHAGGDTLTQYDALNRPVRIAQQSYNDTVLGSAVRPVTCYAYDLLGNLAEIRAGHTRMRPAPAPPTRSRRRRPISTTTAATGCRRRTRWCGPRPSPMTSTTT